MPTIKKNDIIFHTSTTGHLRVPVGERLVARATIRPVKIPASYQGRRVGVTLVVGRKPLPPMVNSRLLSTAFDVFVHADGATSITFNDARKYLNHQEALA